MISRGKPKLSILITDVRLSFAPVACPEPVEGLDRGYKLYNLEFKILFVLRAI